MRERDRIEIRQFMETEQAEEKRREEERMRPMREAQAKFDSTLRELNAVQKENILKVKDDQFQLDPTTLVPIKTADYPKWQRDQAAIFRERHPDYWPSPGNEQVLVQYINLNGGPGLRLVSALQLSRAFIRLREFGLLQERPEEPAPEPQTEPERGSAPSPETPGPELAEGVDPSTGLPRKFTTREIDKMTADEYRRVFQLYGNKKPQFVDARR